MARVNCGYQILDHFNHFSNDRFSHFKIKIMIKNKNIFLEKKILIYGLGKSGIASYKFLKNKSKVYLFDDDLTKKFIHIWMYSTHFIKINASLALELMENQLLLKYYMRFYLTKSMTVD